MNEQELKALEDMAAALLSNEELDTWAELEPGTVQAELKKRGSAIGKAVNTGRLRTKTEHNIALITASRRHSTPAQAMVATMLKRLDL